MLITATAAHGRSKKTVKASKANEGCADRLFEVVPPIMQMLRQEMRSAVHGRLSITQFRVLARLGRGVSGTGELAESIGVSFPAMSRMVDSMVRRGLVKRARPTADRRQVQLTLTAPGQRFFTQVKGKARKSVASQLAILSSEANEKLLESLKVLQNSLLLNLEDTHEQPADSKRSPLRNISLRMRS